MDQEAMKEIKKALQQQCAAVLNSLHDDKLVANAGKLIVAINTYNDALEVGDK